MDDLNYLENLTLNWWNRYQGWGVIIIVLVLDIVLRLIPVFSGCNCELIRALKYWYNTLHPLILAYGMGLIFVKYPLIIRRMFTWDNIPFSKIIYIVAKDSASSEEEVTLGILNAIYQKDLDLEKDVFDLNLDTKSRSIIIKGDEYLDKHSGKFLEEHYEPVGSNFFRSLLYMYTKFLELDPMGCPQKSLKEYEDAYTRLRRAKVDDYKAPQLEYKDKNIFLDHFKQFTMSGISFKRWLKEFYLGKYNQASQKKVRDNK